MISGVSMKPTTMSHRKTDLGITAKVVLGRVPINAQIAASLGSSKKIRPEPRAVRSTAFVVQKIHLNRLARPKAASSLTRRSQHRFGCPKFSLSHPKNAN
jgi:hypothetical protein